MVAALSGKLTVEPLPADNKLNRPKNIGVPEPVHAGTVEVPEGEFTTGVSVVGHR